MHVIESGTARRHNSGVWRIFGPGSVELGRFIQTDFWHIENGTPVFYVDLNLDGLCENVQVQLDVERLVGTAMSSAGFAAGAEIRLRNYIMEALLASLKRSGADHAAYRSRLVQRMAEVKAAAEALPSKKVTIALLQRLGISA